MTPYSSYFLLKSGFKFFFFWKEFTKRGRADFWTNATIGRLFNSWQASTTSTYFFFFRSYLSKLYNVVIFSKAFKFFNIFFFFEQVSIEQLLFLFLAIFSKSRRLNFKSFRKYDRPTNSCQLQTPWQHNANDIIRTCRFFSSLVVKL